MTDFDIEFTHVSVCTECHTDDETELLEFVEFVSGTSPPPFLTSKDVYIDPTELDDFEIIYSSGTLTGVEYQSYSQSSFLCNLRREDNYVHAHSYIESENYDDQISFHEEFISCFDEVDIDPLTILFRGPAVDDLPTVSGDLFGALPSDTEITALRTAIDGDEYRLTFNEDETWISFESPSIANVAPKDVGGKVMEHIEDSRTRLEEGI